MAGRERRVDRSRGPGILLLTGVRRTRRRAARNRNPQRCLHARRWIPARRPLCDRPGRAAGLREKQHLLALAIASPRSCWVVLKGRPPVAAELSWDQVHAFRLSGHHLIKRAPKKDLARVVGDIGGAQAQLMSAAELQIGVRVGCTVKDVRTALWKEKSLVKTWLMRGTLHLVPSEDLPIYTAAMGRFRLRNLNAWLKYTQLTESELTGLFEAIGDALDGNTMTREELITTVGRGRSERVQNVLKSGWGSMLKPVARNGLLCFGPSRGPSVTVVRPQQWLGSWRDLDPIEALAEVARRYLRAYGPATKQDFARWWGAWTGVGRDAWAALADELVPG